MNLTYRIIGRINDILRFQNIDKNVFLNNAKLSTADVENFTKNQQNHLFLHNSINLSRLLEIHQGCIMQYIFTYYANMHNLQIPHEPMQDYLRVNSLALPFADNIAQNILQTIIARMVHTLPNETDMSFFVQTFVALDTTPFIFFYHPFFDNIDLGNGKLNDLPTFFAV